MAKRLILVLTEFPPSFGGMQTHAVALCEWLHARGYEIAVVTYRYEAGPVEMPAFPFPVHRVLSRVAYQANVEKITRLAREINADLIYSSTVYYGEVAQALGKPALCRSAGNDVLRPWIAWPYRWGSRLLDVPWVERQLYRRWRKWDWPERLEGLLLRQRRAVMCGSARQMSCIFANSEFTRRLLDDLVTREATVETLPGGVDVEFFQNAHRGRGQLGMSSKVFYLLTACRLVAKKGLDTLLEAVALLRDGGLNVELLIAGEGRERATIEQKIEARGLESCVRLLGYVSHADLREYMHASDVFVLSSREVVDQRTGLRDVETMGRALCEAAACGMPIVSTWSGGIPSVITDGWDGVLVEPGNVRELAAAIERLHGDAALAREMGLRAAERAAREFHWPVLFAAHEQAIARLLELD